jgi:hypothetical protein
MKYQVAVRHTITNIFIVEADSKEKAMRLALDDDDADYVTHIDNIEGDTECHYSDVTEQEKE